jgi:hypothetical protein
LRPEKLALLVDNVTPEEELALQERQQARCGWTESRAALVALLGGAALPKGITRGGLIDILIDREPQLDPDQTAIIKSWHKRRLIISAPPGSGKTTTLAHLVRRIVTERPGARVLVLAFNRVAEETFAARITRLGVVPSRNVSVMEGDAGGWVMTFDKFCWRVAPADFDSGYSAVREAAAAAEMPAQWDYLIVDESQDNNDLHGTLIDSIVGGGAALFAAGDPCQELYEGCRWMGQMWRDAAEDERARLRYNHRSARAIVDALNVFSRHNFPTLHVDQIACREEEGIVRVHAIRAGDRAAGLMDDTPLSRTWAFERGGRKLAANILGARVAEVVGMRGAQTYALAPVTTRKFGLESTHATIHQTLYESGQRVSDDVEGTGCVVANSRTVKGTERARVVLWGCDLDYSLCVDGAALKKMIYVAMSRARDELHIVMRDGGDPQTWAIMRPLVEDEVKAGARMRGRRADAALIPVSSDSATETGLASVSYLGGTVIERFEVPPVVIEGGDAPPQFIGHYAEALAAEAYGIELAHDITIEVVKRKDECGFFREGGQYVVRELKRRVEALSRVLHELREDVFTNRAARHASIRYSCLASKAWTLGRISREEHLGAMYDTLAALGEWIPAVPTYLVRRSHPQIGYEIDFLAGEIPLEIKYVGALSDVHRRQAAIYAALVGAPYGVLLNVRDGHGETIAAATLRDVEWAAHAFQMIRAARQVSIRDPIRGPAPRLAECVVLADGDASIAVEPAGWALRAIAAPEVLGPRQQRLGPDDIVAMCGGPEFDPETCTIDSVYSEVIEHVYCGPPVLERVLKMLGLLIALHDWSSVV